MKTTDACFICGHTPLPVYLTCLDYAVSRESFSLKKCEQCELLMTDPQPPPDLIERYYQFEDYVSHTGKANNFVNQVYIAARRFTLKEKLKLLHRYSETGNLLDVGCGTGHFLDICKRGGWKVQGVEPSARARESALDIDPNVCSSIDQLNSDTKYNVITLWHVLEHLHDPNECFRQLKDKLNDTGTLFIAVPNYKSDDAHYYNEYWAAFDVPRHLWHFSKKTMEQLIKKHGLKLIDIVPMRLDAFYVSILSEKYKRKNKLSVAALINAIKEGLISNHRAKETINYSSLIYIIQK